MIKKLPFLFLLTAASALSQAPIEKFYGESVDGMYVAPAYVLVTAATGVPHGEGGADQVWNFDLLVEVGSTQSTVWPATDAEILAYPGATQNLSTETTVGTDISQTNLYWKREDQTVSIVGASNPDLTLNYSTDNALLGTFPLEFGDTVTDDVSGTFAGMEYEGTFTGTATTTVDAYGTLTANIGSFAPGTPVTRLKHVQNLSLNYIIPNVGTVTQTTYSYYQDGFYQYPIFRSTETHVVVSLANIDYTSVTDESYMYALLSDETLTVSKFSIAPNPVQDVLRPAGFEAVTGIQVFALNGRLVAQGSASELNVSGLVSGVYVCVIRSASGSESLKFVKS